MRAIAECDPVALARELRDALSFPLAHPDRTWDVTTVTDAIHAIDLVVTARGVVLDEADFDPPPADRAHLLAHASVVAPDELLTLAHECLERLRRSVALEENLWPTTELAAEWEATFAARASALAAARR